MAFLKTLEKVELSRKRRLSHARDRRSSLGCFQVCWLVASVDSSFAMRAVGHEGRQMLKLSALYLGI